MHAVVTSPPYYGLRAYPGAVPTRWADGRSAILGLEATVEEYVDHLVEVFAEVRRVLRKDGTCWLNLGDCHAGGGAHAEPVKYAPADVHKPFRPRQRKLTTKDLLGVPHRVVLALQADGWIWRQTQVWAKGVSFCPTYSGSVMPESTRDRTTHAHEYVFHLAKSTRYYYDLEGNKEPYAESTRRQVEEGYKGKGRKAYAAAGVQNPSDVKRRVIEGIKRAQGVADTSVGAGSSIGNQTAAVGSGRNLRNVWIVAKESFPGAHFATFPTKLVEPIIKLSTSEKGCCPTCAAPWERIVIKEPVPPEVQAAFNAARQATVADTGRRDGHTQRKPNYRRRVIRDEWRPSCKCRWLRLKDDLPENVRQQLTDLGYN